MNDAFYKIWNPEVQAKMDKDTDQFHKSDATLELKPVKIQIFEFDVKYNNI
jgi:hypothetical protein